MSYTKIKGKNIFTGSMLLGADNVLITKTDGCIVDVVPAENAGDNVKEYNGIICPGFVNAHCHIELSHLKKSIPTHTGLVNFVQKVIEHRVEDENIKQNAMQLAMQEMYDNGIVAVGDICNTADSVLLKKQSPIYWQNFIEVSGFVDATSQQRFDDAITTKKKFVGTKATVVPHAPYSVSKTLFTLINASSANELISIHNQECAAENELYKNGKGNFLELYKNLGIDIRKFYPTGLSSLQSWLPYFTNSQKIISVHNSFISEQDVDFAATTYNSNNLFYCLCPNANLYIENTLPPVQMLVDKKINIVLGTDSYASNWQLNMHEEIKTIQKNFTTIPLAKILQWATLNGAIALGIDNVYGSFENGKKPGVLVLNDKAITRLL